MVLANMGSPKKRPLSGRITAKKPMRQTEHVCMDPVAAARLIELRNKRDELTGKVRGNPDLQPELDEVLDDLDECEELVRSETVTFVALSVGKTRWEELKAQHPPTKEQKRQHGAAVGGLAWNLETFPPVMFRECLRVAQTDENGVEVLSELEPEDIKEMLEGDDWNDDELSRLLFAVRMANESAPRIGDLGNV